MSGYLHQWSHWVTGHPHIQFLFMCPVIKLTSISRQLHPGLPVSPPPPPDEEVIQPTSGRCRRRRLTRSSRGVPRGRPHTVVTQPNSLLATARIWWRSTAGQEQIAATVCRDSRSSGSGSISESRFMLAMHRSGTAGRDVTCCGVEAPR